MNKVNLTIADPCHENWEKMTSVEQGKFCNACQKTVVDFTSMSDRQIAEFFKKPCGSVCGRFYTEQLDRDLVVPRKRIPWIRYFFQFALPAFLLSFKASAQKGKVAINTQCSPAATNLTIKGDTAVTEQSDEINGIIIDNNANPVGYSSVYIKGTKYGVSADAQGKFRIKAKTGDVLVVACVGFSSQEVVVSSPSLAVMLHAYQTDLLGVVVVAGNVARKKPKPIPLISRIVDSAFSRFSVYPNPVQNQSVLKVDVRKIREGNYQLEVINLAGQTVQTKELLLKNKMQTIELNSPSIAGTYTIRLTNKGSMKIYAEKLVVE